jgi:hypothetical protein
VLRDPPRTPHSAARHNERVNRQLLSPEHRRIPRHQPQPAIVPLRFGQIQVNHPFLLGEDPFQPIAVPLPPPSLPPGPSPATVRRQMEDLHAQAAAAAALMVPPQHRGRRRQAQPAAPPFPAPAPPATPENQVWLEHRMCTSVLI